VSLIFENDYSWDGSSLSVSARTKDGTVRCVVPRDAIHCIPVYNDAIGREIERDASDIMDRLKPYFLRKLTRGEGYFPNFNRTLEIGPDDVLP
jgi:hypothetical protein